MARLESPSPESGNNKNNNGDGDAPSSELWTLQEEAQGVAPSYRLVPLTRRPASFSVSSNNHTSNNQLPRGRSGSYDTVGIEEEFSSAGQSSTQDGGGDGVVNSEGFPLLLRRRTFTEPSLSNTTKRRCYYSSFDNDGVVGRGLQGHHRAADGGGGGGGGGRGRVPLSMSEDNMLSLLSKRSSSQALEARRSIPPPTPATTPDKLERDMSMTVSSSSVSNSSSGSISSSLDAHSEGVGGAAGTLPMQQQQQRRRQEEEEEEQQQQSTAAERARRNGFVIRLHRLGLVQDTSRCVMDIVEGRAATATATAGAAPCGRVASAPPAVTLEEVKEHLRSLPERYALSVDPEEALTHMALIADITSDTSSAGGAPSAASTPSTVRVLVKSGGGGNVGGGRERYTVTVACRQSPVLLGAVSSSLRSSGASCLDADVVTKAPKGGLGAGVSLARFQVEIACGGKAGLSSPTGAAGAVAPSRPRSPAEEEESVDGPAASARLAELLSSTIAANIRAAETEDSARQQQQQQQQREEETDEEGDGDEGGKEARVGSAGRCDRPQAQRCTMNAARAGAGAAEAAEADRAAARGRSGTSACGTAATHREVRREPLARRQGCFFLAEADANALGSNGNSDAFSFGGGGGGGGGSGGSGGVGDGSGCVAKPFTSKSDDAAGAFPNVSSSRGNNDNHDALSNRNNHNNNNNNNNGALNVARWADSISSNPTTSTTNPTTTHNNSPNNDNDEESCYPTIPTEDIELLELAGKGRFSRTYRARWRGATVAVKTLELPPETGASASAESDRSVIVAEFERELHIVRKLRHPNVCGFRGVCVASPHHVSLVYDFLANGTLGDRLRDTGGNNAGGDEERQRPQPLRSAGLVRIVKDVVDGMLYLHELGILHRDLKPDNILLDADDRAVIADFGLSRLCQPTSDHTAETGTYRWMAPEVIRHEPYGHAADVYSFGVVLWQVLTRRQPFEGLTPIQAAFSVARQGLRPPLPPSAPSALSSLIGRCWHPSPGARPSFSQVRSELPEIERQMLSL